MKNRTKYLYLQKIFDIINLQQIILSLNSWHIAVASSPDRARWLTISSSVFQLTVLVHLCNPYFMLIFAGDDTWLFPLLQLPPFMVVQDSSVTEDIFKCLPANSTVHLCSPYFNLTEQYILSLLHKCKAPVKVLIPHPTVSCHKLPM